VGLLATASVAIDGSKFKAVKRRMAQIEESVVRYLQQLDTALRPGTILDREWNGQMQQVALLAGGFAWNSNTYPSPSKVAFAITGTRWNGPKFFGLRDRPLKGSSP
jgi:hypothetical protein